MMTESFFFLQIALAKTDHNALTQANRQLVSSCTQGLVPGVLVDALDGRGTSNDPVHQIRVTVGEHRFSRESVGVHIQPSVSQAVAASLVRQSAAVAQGPGEGPPN